jgi:Fe-S cluster assembly scaffold protein SufB
MTNNVPARLYYAVELLRKRFTIYGLCDQMYICNVVAYLNHFGNGSSLFEENEKEISYETAETIQRSYSTLIKDEDIEEVYDILKTAKLDMEKAKAGLIRQMNRFVEEAKNCDEWRVKYLQKCFMAAQSSLAEIESVS